MTKRERDDTTTTLHKLLYFNFPGKAEAIRLALTHAGVAFARVGLGLETVPSKGPLKDFWHSGNAVAGLGALMAARNHTRLDVLKIDVEGYELEVLDGAREAFERRTIKVILAECDFDPEDTQHTYFNDLWSYLRIRNFSFFGLYDVIHYENGMGIGFCNALFIERTADRDRS